MAALTQAPVSIPLDVFPDGLRTTGQHPPLYDLIAPFEKFPKEISGPTVWKAEDYREHPEKWTHRFSADEIAELSATADEFLAKKIPLTGISKVYIYIFFGVKVNVLVERSNDP
jgi:hypothetical protein